MTNRVIVGRPGRLGVVLMSVLACVLMLPVARARAGLWEQVLCQNPDGSTAPVQGLTFTDANASAFGNGSWSATNCVGGLRQTAWAFQYGGYVIASGPAAMPATSATATYTAPPGSSLDGGSITGLDIIQSGSSLNTFDAWVSTPQDAPDSADAVATCQGPTLTLLQSMDSCSWAPGPALQSLALPPRGGTQLFITAGCSVADTDPCSNVSSAIVLWDWADILLSDNTLPTASGFGGSLLGSGAVHGTANLTFTASDPSGPGIYNVTVRIDGNTIYSGTPSTNGGECAPVGTDPTSGAMMFDFQQPCPTSEQLDTQVDTTQLADGDHRLQVTVEDAAANNATVLDQAFTTQNLTTVASTTSESAITTTTPSSPTVPASGSPAPPAAAAPVTYAFKLAKASAKLIGSTVHRRYLGSKVVLSGMIVNPAGAPAPGIAVSARIGSLSGTGLRTIASTTTDGSGRFKLSVPRGDSRTVQLVVGQQSVSFMQEVRPNVSLKVVSRRGGRLIFTGRVAINRHHGPAAIVELADRGSAGWQALANVTVDKHGDYRYVYRASPLAIGRSFQIRATTAATTLWQQATSAVVTAKVT